jgi:hypothetical protein
LVDLADGMHHQQLRSEEDELPVAGVVGQAGD